MQSQGSRARLARIQDRIQKVEARIDAASQKIAALQQKLADKCSAQTAPVPATGTDQGTAPNRADRCARAQTRLEKAQERLQKAKDRLARVKTTPGQYLQGDVPQTHDGMPESGGDASVRPTQVSLPGQDGDDDELPF